MRPSPTLNPATENASLRASKVLVIAPDDETVSWPRTVWPPTLAGSVRRAPRTDRPSVPKLIRFAPMVNPTTSNDTRRAVMLPVMDGPFLPLPASSRSAPRSVMGWPLDVNRSGSVSRTPVALMPALSSVTAFTASVKPANVRRTLGTDSRPAICTPPDTA